MTHYEIFLSVSITGFEILLCVLVCARSLQSRLPFFAVYAGTILASSLSLSFVFLHFGFRSVVSYYADWIALAINLFVRSLAIAELCRYSLQAYRGIWALAWRLLSVIAIMLLVHASLDARGQPNWIAAYGLTIERDIEISSVVILVAMLLISRYYLLRTDSLQIWIATGFCIFCVVEFVNNTVLRDLFTQYMGSWTSMKSQVDRVNELWNTVQVSASYVSLGIWCYALRKPIPVPAKSPVLLSSEVYNEYSPAVNLRLRAFNDRLAEMLKP